MDKRLYRSRDDRLIAGVCGGLAEYLDVDPTLIRLLWLLISLPGAVGVPLYFLAWILVPPAPELEGHRSERRTRWAGALLLVLGSLLLANNLFPWMDLGRLWPVALIVLGVVLLVRGRRDD